MSHVWPHTQLSSTGFVDGIWSNWVFNLFYVRGKWPENGRMLETGWRCYYVAPLQLHSGLLVWQQFTVCAQAHNGGCYLVAASKTIIQRVMDLSAHRNIDTNVLYSWRVSYCGCWRLHSYQTKENIKYRHIWQATCFRYGILFFTNRIATARPWKLFQVLNKWWMRLTIEDTNV